MIPLIPTDGRAHRPDPGIEVAGFGHWCAAWDLTRDGVPVTGNNAVVVPVRTVDGTAAVLRIARPGGDDACAWVALTAWRGDVAVQLLRHDADHNVSLLERLDPSRTWVANPRPTP